MRPAQSVLLIAALFLPAIHIAQSQRPNLPFFDWNACPFEGCKYGQWTARKPVLVYDTWKRTRRTAARLMAGEKVVAVTGVVITFKPEVIRINLDLPENGLKRGDIILTYTYRGEGSWAVWFKGMYHEDFGVPSAYKPEDPVCQKECAATYIQMGKKEWWAKIKLKSGKTAWVNMDKEFESFDGVDSLG